MNSLNIRQIKLDLTVALLNQPHSGNLVQTVKDLMMSFHDVGSFAGLFESSNELDRDHIQNSYALQFENVTVDLNTVSIRSTNHTIVNGFSLR
ncbi:MAG: hypothetical protein IPH04_13525 [Saprospirales bacterium]|jgi:hypothetical protein|nr:hypothetical protein [Saprospirales bacterium]MBK6903782.1 hypothetical protein [Saprospirales bacterium]MBK7335925.1 hypothetical protein [Saprospirales bacterium]